MLSRMRSWIALDLVVEARPGGSHQPLGAQGGDHFRRQRPELSDLLDVAQGKRPARHRHHLEQTAWLFGKALDSGPQDLVEVHLAGLEELHARLQVLHKFIDEKCTAT